MLRRNLRALGRVGAIVRRVIGAPDYERYLSHMRQRHPDRTPMSRDQFIHDRLRERYDKPGARCC
jgi:uncharacterized short protein YbdD (DUF466 family)